MERRITASLCVRARAGESARRVSRPVDVGCGTRPPQQGRGLRRRDRGRARRAQCRVHQLVAQRKLRRRRRGRGRHRPQLAISGDGKKVSQNWCFKDREKAGVQDKASTINFMIS
eukprot:6188021-Pleurochrysis_carterae.AAC.1